jgi:hypothetical protein
MSPGIDSLRCKFKFRWIQLASATLLVGAFVAQVRGQDVLYFTSSPLSAVGGGLTETLTPQNGYTVSLRQYGDQGAYTNAVEFDVTQSTDYWILDFVGPNQTLVTPGLYANATRWPFQGSGAGLSFVGDGRGDNSLTGDFDVLQADYDNEGQLQSFAADFVQYDNGNPNDWNMGSIRYNSAIPVPEPSGLVLLGVAAIALLSRSATNRNTTGRAHTSSSRRRTAPAPRCADRPSR